MSTNSSSRILITGGAGFIGSHVVDACLERGHTVLVYDNFSVGRREHLPAAHSHLSVIEGDIRDERCLGETVAGFDPTHVVHLAALHFIPYCIAHPFETIDVNIGGTERVLWAVDRLRAPSLRALLFASSAAVYAPSTLPHQETESTGPTDVYGLTKETNERQGHLFQQARGIPVIAARIFNAYGPRETNPHLIPEIARQINEDSLPLRLGNMQTKRSYIFVRDLADALTSLVLSETVQGFDTFNIGSAHEYDAQQIVQTCAEILGRPLPVAADPARQRASDRPRLQPSLEKIRRTIAWEEKGNLRAGLREILTGQP